MTSSWLHPTLILSVPHLPIPSGWDYGFNIWMWGGQSSIYSSPGGSSEGLRLHSVFGNDSLDVENETFLWPPGRDLAELQTWAGREESIPLLHPLQGSGFQLLFPPCLTLGTMPRSSRT